MSQMLSRSCTRTKTKMYEYYQSLHAIDATAAPLCGRVDGVGRALPLFPVALRQGLPLDLLRELVVQKHVRPIGKIGQDLVEALRALG